MIDKMLSSLPTQAIKANINDRGVLGGINQWATKAYLRETKSVSGMNYFEEDWDVLVVLDACRYDLMAEVQDEFGFISTLESRKSLGSATWEWMPATFELASTATLKDTAYVCANPYSNQFLEESQFFRLDEVWTYAWDEELGTVPPRPVTDRAITVGRELTAERIIVHYMQPHVPFINSSNSPKINKNFADSDDIDDWNLVKSGKKELDEAIKEYTDNLRAVLSDIKILLSNMDAERVVITSDHGNAIGEYGLYGHNDQVPIDALYKVPWVETTASDKGVHEAENYNIEDSTDRVNDRLKSLGYI